MFRTAAPVQGLHLNGEAGRRIRTHAWEDTPLGPLDQWPPSMRAALDLILAHPLPMALAWGPRFLTFYNDAYLPLFGGEPDPLGRPFLALWGETRHTIAPQMARALAGESSHFEGARFMLRRGNKREEAFFDYTFSPVRDDGGTVVAVLNTAVETTEQVRAERQQRAMTEALRHTERRFRALVTAGDVTIFRMSPDWQLMYELDSQNLEVHAGPVQDWPGRYIPSVDRERVAAAIDKAIRTRSLFELEHRIRLVDGGVGWVFSRAVPLLDEKGDILEWFGASRDLAESRRAIDKLHESEARHRALFESIDEGVCLLERLPARADGRRDFRYVAVNPSMQAMFGIGDLSGQSIRDNFPDLPETWFDDLDRVLASGEPVRLVRESSAHPGMVLELSIKRVEGISGYQLLLVMRDITERKQIQERRDFLLKLSDALRPLADPAAIQGEAARLLRAHFDVGWCCYAEFDREERTALVLEDATRPGVPSLVGRHDLSDQPRYIDFLRTGKLLNVPDLAHYDLISPSFLARYTAMGLHSLLGVALVKEGRLLAQLVMCDTMPRQWPQLAVDILAEVAQRTWSAVERARAEQSLARELARQKEVDRRKDEFLAVLGHELRNPLAPISTGLALIERTGRDPALVGRLLPMLQRQVVHLIRLVDDLLDMSRVSRGRIELRPASLDLNHAVMAAVEQVQSLIEARHHGLTLHLSEQPLEVRGDFERLTQVVANLLTNAAKYSAPGGEITVRTEADRGEALVRVQDRGFGIPPDRLEALFEMFVQVPEHRKMDGGSGGLGIGLALARQLVRMHGGRLQAFSAGLGQGSEFVMRLPLSPRADEGPEERPGEEPEPVS